MGVGSVSMTKRKKKPIGMKERLFWSCARPEGSFIPNKKHYSRKHAKNEFKKELQQKD